MKKVFSILISALLAASFLTACQPDKEKDNDSINISSQETPPIVSEISSVVSSPVYEDSSSEETSSEETSSEESSSENSSASSQKSSAQESSSMLSGE